MLENRNKIFAFIRKPAKNSMQSGPSLGKNWLIEFRSSQKYNDVYKTTGWISSNFTNNQNMLYFATIEEAKEYATKNDIKFEVILPKERKIVKKSYANNFV